MAPLDPLDQFSAALASEHDGEVAAPGVTRTRILERLTKRRTPRSTLKVLFAIPLFMLGAGTALAASGQLPLVLDPVARWLESDAAPTSASPLRQKKHTRLVSSSAVAPASPAAPASVAAPASPAPTPPATVPPEAGTASARAPESASPQFAPPLAASASPHEPVPDRGADPEPAPAASEPGLAIYATAQRAHFRSKDYAAAAAHYESYLESAPSGSFVTEARYNRSLCLLRLGRAAEARPILAAFARGAYGDYRRFEAARLLDAMAE